MIGLLPIAAMLWLFTVLVITLSSRALTVVGLGDLALTRISLVIQILLWAGIGLWRGGRVHPFRGDVWPAATAGLWLAIGALFVATKSFEFWSRFVASGTDFGRHVIMVGQSASKGFLDYGENEYPRGLHASVAQLTSMGPEPSYAATWQALESTLWVMLGLTLLAILVVAARTLKIVQPRISAVVIVGVCALTMAIFVQSMWFTVFFRLGYATTIAAGLVVASVIAWATDRGGRSIASPSVLLIPLAGIAVLAHVWTLLLPTLAAVFIAMTVALLRINAQEIRDQVLGSGTRLRNRCTCCHSCPGSSTVRVVLG